MKTNQLTAAMLLIACVLLAHSRVQAAETMKQPVFAIVPDNHSYSAWELYLVVDQDNPQNVRALELDELTNKNAKDSTYEGVLDAAKDSNTQKQLLGTLPAAEFGSGSIAVRQNDALQVSVSPLAKNALRLQLSMRINLDQRFEIGGKAENKRSVQLKYDLASKTWHACAARLIDPDGHNAVGSGCLPVTGIAFPVTGTGIYRIVAATDTGEVVIVMDR